MEAWSAVTLPGALFLIDCARDRIGLREVGGYARRRWPVYAALAAGAAAVLAVRFFVLGSVAHPLGPLGADLLAQGVPRIWTVAGIWTHYVRLMVLPVDLSSDYSPKILPIGLGWNWLNSAGVALALVFLALAWATWRDRALEAGSSSARLVAFGPLGADAHAMFGSRAGNAIWQPELVKFLAEIGLPHEPPPWKDAP